VWLGYRVRLVALGARRSRVARSVVLRGALAGLVTGSLLAIARAVGETAPLLFTSIGSQLFNLSPLQPTAAMPLVIYADGAIDSGAGNLTDLHGLAEQLRRGQVTTSLEDGASASAHHLASWRFAEPEASIDADMLLGEVAGGAPLVVLPTHQSEAGGSRLTQCSHDAERLEGHGGRVRAHRHGPRVGRQTGC